MSVPEGASSETTPIRYVRGDIPDSRVPSYWGDRYHTETPDALDLQDRAALCINCLTEVTDPDYDYEVYWFVFFKYKPAFMLHEYADIVQVKFMEALPLLRMISGSRQNPHVERRWMEVIRHQLAADDFSLYPKEPGPLYRCYEEGVISGLTYDGLSVNVPLFFPGGSVPVHRFYPECYSTTNLIGYDLPVVFDRG